MRYNLWILSTTYHSASIEHSETRFSKRWHFYWCPRRHTIFIFFLLLPVHTFPTQLTISSCRDSNTARNEIIHNWLTTATVRQVRPVICRVCVPDCSCTTLVRPLSLCNEVIVINLELCHLQTNMKRRKFSTEFNL